METLPVEIINQILSHLVHPRSRLPGLTEVQSAHDFPRQTKLEIKNREDLSTFPDADRWAPYRVKVSLTNTTPMATGPTVYNLDLAALPRPLDAPDSNARYRFSPASATSATSSRPTTGSSSCSSRSR